MNNKLMAGRLMMVGICLFALALSTGCRNRCYNACNNGGLFSQSTVAPPPTYGINIPSVAQNQNYYDPRGNRTAGLNTRTAAPTPATGTPNGWNPKDAAANQSSGQQPANQQQPLGQQRPANTNNVGSGAATNLQAQNISPVQTRSVLTNGTNFVETTPPGRTTPNFRTASTAPLPGSGVSFTDSTDYRTTRTNEQTDPTRLPATDASTVRAPASNFPTGAPTRLAQNVLPQNVRSNGSPNQTFSLGQTNPNVVNGQPFYVGNPIIVPQGQPQHFYQGQFASNPGFANNPGFGQSVNRQFNGQFNTGSAVVAQSTTSYAGSGTQVGWRDRDLNSRRE